MGQGEVGGCTQRIQTMHTHVQASFREALVGTGWAISPPTHNRILKTVLLLCKASLSSVEGFS